MYWCTVQNLEALVLQALLAGITALPISVSGTP
jgi:hypothetical protein